MASAIDKAKQIGLALARKHAEYSFKAGMTLGRIPFVELEIWRNIDRKYVGSDLRSERFYNELAADDVREVVDSIAHIIKVLGKK
jgi:hypothetical protein